LVKHLFELLKKRTNFVKNINNMETVSIASQKKQLTLSKKKTQRYQELVEKLEFESITDAEHAEFMRLANHEEKLRNQRVKYLIELAQLRAVSLPQLMIDLGLKTAQNV
jgi:hypothetical protein